VGVVEFVENAVVEKTPNAATGELGAKLALEGAVPLRSNLVKRAIGGVEEATWE
jgi:hypothetical protein